MFSLLISGCDPALYLTLKPNSASYKPVSDDLHWRGGFILDTAGVNLTIGSYLWGATYSHHTTDLVIFCEIKSKDDFIFPYLKSVLIDSTGWTRRASHAGYESDILPDEFIYKANEKHELYFRVNDRNVILFPSKLLLPKLVFVTNHDTLTLPIITIEGPIPKK